MSAVELLRARFAEGPPSGIATLLGMDVDLVEHGEVVFTCETAPQFANPFGTVHGGIVATLLDSAMTMAVVTVLPDGATTTTLGLEVKYVRPVAVDAGRLRAEGVVVHAGRRVVTAEGRLVGPDGRLLATATTTCLVL
jgi:uncharacterized protein (TIGR00369 family)